MGFCGHVGRVTIFCQIFTIAHCLLVSLGLGLCDVHTELLDFYLLINIVVDVSFSYSAPFCCCVSGMMIVFFYS